jgi:hypothetical protein
MALIPPTPWDDPEARERKKFNKVMRNAVLSAGIGIGLMLVKPFFIGTEEGVSSESMAKLFNMLGWGLIGYGVTIVLSGLFLRKMLFKINLVAFYFVLPAIILKALMDWQQ